MAGTMNKLISVETTKPPMTATPIGARELGSPAQPIAIGVMPAIRRRRVARRYGSPNWPVGCGNAIYPGVASLARPAVSAAKKSSAAATPPR
jgi:hypothetical protein